MLAYREPDEGDPIAEWNAAATPALNWPTLFIAFIIATAPIWVVYTSMYSANSALAALLLFNMVVCLCFPGAYCVVHADQRKVLIPSCHNNCSTDYVLYRSYGSTHT